MRNIDYIDILLPYKEIFEFKNASAVSLTIYNSLKFSKYKNCNIEIYPSTEHGFAFSERNTYVKEAAEMHWERLIHLFDKNLKKK